MAVYTAGELIKRALRLLGVLASGEEPEANEYADSIMAFNQMIDSWSTERLSVYGSMEQVYTWPAGQATVSLGPSSTEFPGSVCPVLLGSGTYFLFQGTSYVPSIINREQYSSIALKTLSGPIPRFIYPNMNIPSVSIDCLQMTVYPVPDQDLEWHFISVIPLTEVSDVNDTIYVPKGYYEAYVFNLAMRLAPEFGVAPSKEVRQTASKSRVNIKRINNPNVVMNLPLPLVSRGWYDIQTDGN